MSIAENTEVKAPSPAVQFRKTALAMAGSLLRDWVGEERAREATGRIAAAISASAAAAKDPSEFYACTPQSVATCVAVAALTGIMPSTGAAALAYVYPQAARRGEPPLLMYQLSHRGCNALARRCGQTMIPIPISHKDTIEVDDDGDVKITARDIDNPPTSYDELRGVVLIVKQLDTGLTITKGWIPKKLIDQRKAVSRSAKSEYSPWAKWGVEQAMKTAMHYAIARGWCVVDDTEAVRALSVDTENDTDLLLMDHSAVTPKIGVQRTSVADVIERTTAKQNADMVAQTLADFKGRLNAATKVGSLSSLKTSVVENEFLTNDQKTELIADIEDRIAIIESEAE